MAQRSRSFIVACGLAFTALNLNACAEAAERAENRSAENNAATEPLDYSRDVRPILSDHCFACHGPDAQERKADLRLDQSDGVHSVITSGDPDDSELVVRIHAEDDSLMPPAEFGKPLSAEQLSILERWIAEGGEVQDHWAFTKPQKQALPSDAGNPIDHFINAKIKAAGLVPNPQAAPRALLRRASLAITGLPPSREQIERVATSDPNSSDAVYEQLVDQWLASPAFGQQFGRYWLDLVRFADTHGLHLDNYREMWPYRDWVIDAINSDMPFDQFVTEQLAGDLLPNATLGQQIASGFNRLNVTTSEGGSIYEEVFARNVIDRTDSFGTIFLGLTTQCAVCHDHKFDPITQKDYYSLSAFFNSLDGQALDGNNKDHPPVVQVPSDQDRQQLAEYDQQIQELREELAGDIDEVDTAQRQWELSLIESATVADHIGHQAKLLPRSARETTNEIGESADKGNAVVVDSSGVVYSNLPAKPRATLTIEIPYDRSFRAHRWQTIILDVLPDPKTDRVGISSNGNAVLTEFTVEALVAGNWHLISVTDALADIEQSGDDFKVKHAIDGQRDGKGWAVAGHQTTGPRSVQFALPNLARTLAMRPRKLRLTLDFRSVYAAHQFFAMKFRLSDVEPQVSRDEQITLGPIHSVGPFPVESDAPGYSRVFVSEQRQFDPTETFDYQGKNFHWIERPEFSPIAVHTLPSESDAVEVHLLHQRLDSPKAQTIDLLLGTSDGHVVYLNNKRLQITKAIGPIDPLSNTYRLELKEGQNDLYLKAVTQSRPAQLTYAYRSAAVPAPPQIAAVVSHPPDQRTDEETQSIRAYYRKVVCEHPAWTALQDMVRGMEKAKEDYKKQIPVTLVWKELATPRQAHLLIRGQYDQPGEPVPRAVPEFLPPMPEGIPADRLGLAKWLTSPEQPLASRVIVNRVWQWLFGIGIVKSSEDFGSQGEPPSHQALLDWLAVDFQDNGWDLKRLVKQIVMSDAFRRDAKVSPAQLSVDPKNRFLARGPRFRLDAEVLRDQALSVAGLLNEQLSGPSVKPPQPDGLWYAVAYTRSNTANFKADKDPEKRLRRSVYIFWKRTSPPPQMSTFDAPSRESCTARRERTNTPLQALVLMNEHQYLLAAKYIAIRTIRQCEATDDRSRLAWMFETVTSRPASDTELDELSRLLDELRATYEDDTDAAKAFLSVDEERFETLEIPEHAAWMMIASVLLNLDEVVNN
ncbi:PSD1 and planctomycete cytochrome C domain-containing protein [Rhodopirellula sp. MGV]|uniref:PSD1 and planctomycete cytochrome C domain-containing protein n=1 Tax=Rhodopirellula sp. MGV TaxID=2023130 RepID=UPI000B97AD61|nr:PSD1 and planctomycete cytochrome C domain-containing protein [Rhodopirellula sp. MGV]OYP34983.1 hypothetical protein CGZ80_13285 [Rhodopirellula sp. MGV]PNY38121.1 DUF1553 domain-containing protein [Rhodopirellula baltica]